MSDPNQPGGGPSDFPPPPSGQPAYGQPDTAAAGGAGRGGGPPPNYLVWAILTTLFCCLPLGIASIVFAAQVNSKYTAGDVAGARTSPSEAKQFAIWSAIVGVVVLVIYAARSSPARDAATVTATPTPPGGATAGRRCAGPWRRGRRRRGADGRRHGRPPRARALPDVPVPRRHRPDAARAAARCGPCTPSTHGDLAGGHRPATR